jgi:Lrp/AsnC family leucine-responsive transcriptional regulator
MSVLDIIDRRIIGVLVSDGRIAVRELAERIALSASATSDRLKRLEQSGVITGYGARIDPAAAGREIQAIIEVQLDPASGVFEIDAAIAEMPQVVDAFHLTGRFDYQLRIACPDIEGIEVAIRHLKEDLGVRETSTRLILRGVAGTPKPIGTDL